MSGLDFLRFHMVLYSAQLQFLCLGCVFHRNIILGKQNTFITFIIICPPPPNYFQVDGGQNLQNACVLAHPPRRRPPTTYQMTTTGPAASWRSREARTTCRAATSWRSREAPGAPKPMNLAAWGLGWGLGPHAGPGAPHGGPCQHTHPGVPVSARTNSDGRFARRFAWRRKCGF